MAVFHKTQKSLALVAAVWMGCASSAVLAQDGPGGPPPEQRDDRGPRPEGRRGGPGGRGEGHRGGPGERGPGGHGAHGGPGGWQRGPGGQGGFGGGPGGGLHRFLKDLALSDEQQTQIDALLKKAGEDIRAIHEEARQRAEAVREQLKADVLAQLDDTQKETLQKKLDELPKRGPEDGRHGPGGPEGDRPAPDRDRPQGEGRQGPGGPGGPGGPPPQARGERGPRGEAGSREGGPREGFRGQRLEALLEDLDLTQEQKDQVQAILTASREQGRAIAEANQDDPESRRAAMRELREKQQEQINAVLTPEQAEKLEQKRQELRSQFGGGGEGRPNRNPR